MNSNRMRVATPTSFATAGLLILALALPTEAQSALILDTGDPTAAPTSFSSTPRAAQFTLGSGATIDGLQSFVRALGGNARFSIYGDASGLPGTRLFTTIVSLSATSGAGEWRGASGLTWSLAAGTYWVGLDSLALEGRTSLSWGLCGDGEPCVFPRPASKEAAFESITSTWSERFLDSGWRVLGTTSAAVPTPATGALLVIGLLGAAAARRRPARPTRG
jgi:hypothetical protein